MNESVAQLAARQWPDDGIYRLFTTAYCGYCHAAVRLLSQRGLVFEQFDVSSAHDARRVLTERTGVRTVPQIWHGAVFVGGYTDLVPYLAQDED